MLVLERGGSGMPLWLQVGAAGRMEIDLTEIRSRLGRGIDPLSVTIVKTSYFQAYIAEACTPNRPFVSVLL